MRNELIQKAEAYLKNGGNGVSRASAVTLKVARLGLTAEATLNLQKRLTSRRALAGHLRQLLRCMLAAGGILALFFMPNGPKDGISGAHAFVGWTLLVGVASLMMWVLLETAVSLIFSRDLGNFYAGLYGTQVGDTQSKSDLLRPLAGTQFCQPALRCLNVGGPDAAAWRDLAIAERGQLHVFDYGVLSILATQYRRERNNAEKQELSAAACRAVHGLS